MTKPLTSQFFHRKNVGREVWKYQFQCKVCRNLDNKSYSRTNAERIQAYRDAHQERQRAYNRAYYETKHEEIKTQVANYREQNREQARAAVRRWHKLNPDRKRVLDARRRAGKLHAPGSHTAAEVWALAESQDWLCAYCEIPLFGEFHVDHMMPLSRGGSDGWENLAITCPMCNMRKSARTAEEFMLWRATV